MMTNNALIKGVLIGTAEMDIVMQQLNLGSKVIYMGDAMSSPSNIEFIKAPLLVPDYNCLKYFVDGSKRDYEIQYNRMLSSPLAAESFASILSVLAKGINVVMYFPQENAEFNYSTLILKFIQNTFGITAKTKTTMPVYDLNFDQPNARLLFQYNFISAKDYVMMSEELLDVDINKIKIELSDEWKIPPTLNNEDYVKELTRVKDEILNGGKPLLPLMVKK